MRVQTCCGCGRVGAGKASAEGGHSRPVGRWWAHHSWQPGANTHKGQQLGRLLLEIKQVRRVLRLGLRRSCLRPLPRAGFGGQAAALRRQRPPRIHVGGAPPALLLDDGCRGAVGACQGGAGTAVDLVLPEGWGQRMSRAQGRAPREGGRSLGRLVGCCLAAGHLQAATQALPHEQQRHRTSR